MAPRIASPWWFRADGALLPWARIFDEHMKQADNLGGQIAALLRKQREAVKRRPADIQLRWACAKQLGVPFGPFTVWQRSPKDSPKRVDASTRQRGESLELRWGFVAAIIEVDCTVRDGTRAAALFATRTGGGLAETVGAAAVRGAAGANVTLHIRCGGATRALLLNADLRAVRVQTLDDVVNDPNWKELERVGLPVPEPWPGTAYDTGPQGLVDSPVDPVQAAFERIQRGGPPLGWFPLTEAARVAPPWFAPDPVMLLKEIASDLLPNIVRLYRPGIDPHQQQDLLDNPAVASPQSGGRTSSLTARAELPPLALLTLPAYGDPFLALATGFGTAYSLERHADDQVGVGRADFLVTAEYKSTPFGGGPAIIAAFVPTPADHSATGSPTNLAAERAGLVAPELRDAPWRETVRVSWDRAPSGAALGRPTGASLARYDTTGGLPAEPLLPTRAAGDLRPLLMVPDGPPATPNFARSALVDSAATIPLGSGGRTPGYAAAVQDVFGVWSRWEDVIYTGAEPPPQPPRVIALALDSSYAGTTTCPATLALEIGVDWADRTPARVEVAAIFFRMAAPNTPPPPGLSPASPPPAGGFRRDITLPFAGDTLSGPGGVLIEHLDSAGENLVAPGVLQGEQGRRYRARIPIPTLDFAATPRWGVQVWVRSRITALGADTVWSPPPARPALAAAASPVPVAPLPPPQPPGVPVGSVPDAQGCSHARIRWSLPAGADAQKVIVWEVAETALRQAAGLPQRAAEGRIPGWRLADLRATYDDLGPTQRRAAFRRLIELPGTAREVDVTLPRGTQDIHLYTITVVTSTGVETPWPSGPTPHVHLQAVTSPRLRRPAAPRVRAIAGAGGTATITLSATSRVPVREFQLFRTRSAEAARKAETMGPSFAVVIATPPTAGTTPDPATGELTYSATWTGSFAASWDEWFVRAVAVPVDDVPAEAVRGLPSPASDVVALTVLPDAAPDLLSLTADTWGAANDGVVVFSATSAPFRLVALGAHKLSGQAGAVAVPAQELQTITDGPVVAGAAPPPGANVAPVLVRGPRAAGRTPIALWFQRPVAADPVEVTLRIADPLGRVSEQRLTVPGWVPPPAVLPSLTILDVFVIRGRGVILTIESDALVDAEPAYALEASAASAGRPVLFPPGARPRPVRRVWPLNEIPTRAGVFGPAETLQAVRTTSAPPHQYQVLVRMAVPLTVGIAIVLPDGRRVRVTQEVTG